GERVALSGADPSPRRGGPARHARGPPLRLGARGADGAGDRLFRRAEVRVARLTLVPAASEGTATARTLVADSAAEQRIERDLAGIREAVANLLGRRLVSLLLVGGYARREGSVVARGGGLGPYND